MFRRTFWFTAGAAAGVWATNKVHRKFQQLTPESLAAQAANKAIDAGHRIKDFALDVQAGMRQREAELGEALGTASPSGPPGPSGLPGPADPHGSALPPQRGRAALGSTPGPRARQGHSTHIHPHSYNRNEDH
ncbi:hypothetical protein [Streptomyces yaizuensis]|uniref:DUF6167 family protein n=1 Tax=Streptomyces yaizuensis TaxID=2989713 RepID=A0ABQ5P1K8_9ACTN|nr:hypothetical protein [Streptomyces sp. YSPA8]GLF96382.1 DUF6167 family protein [Streptomyces sp. YSPA8]